MPTYTLRHHRRRVLFFLLLACTLALTGCTIPWLGDAEDITTDSCIAALPPAPPAVTGVFVEPDDGYPPVLDEIAHARCSLDVTIYMLTNQEIFDALLDARARGVRVRVILDEYPYGMFGNQQEARDRLEAGGVEVQWGSRQFQFTHAKYIVADARVTLIMNQNLTGAAFRSNREFGVVTTDPDVVRQAQALFDADWDGTDVTHPGPLIISPIDSRARITALINEATTSIDFYAEVIRDDGILGALRDAVDRGVRVRLIVNGSLDPAEEEALAALSLAGVEVRTMSILYIHSKTMIIDGEAALIGSQNYTMTSLDRNREVGLVIKDPRLVARVNAVFERDWERSVPAAAKDPSGTVPVYVRTFTSPFSPTGSTIVVTP